MFGFYHHQFVNLTAKIVRKNESRYLKYMFNNTFKVF